MAFERYNQPLLPRRQWLKRVGRSFIIAGTMVSLALSIGIAGYHFLGRLPFVDAILESCMILGGMGPVAGMTNDGVKLFASAYALFSGLMLVSIVSVILAPWLHRLLHHLHVDEEEEENNQKKSKRKA